MITVTLNFSAEEEAALPRAFAKISAARPGRYATIEEWFADLIYTNTRRLLPDLDVEARADVVLDRFTNADETTRARIEELLRVRTLV